MRAIELDDADIIRGIMTHPRVYPKISDDASPAPGAFVPVLCEGLHYIGIARECDSGGDSVDGLILYHRHNAVTYEAHTCLTPALWGRAGRQGALLTVAWMFAHTDCRKIIGMVPADNPLLLRFTTALGFATEGVNRQSLLRGGKLLDQTIVGLTKEDYACQQQP